MKYKSKPAFPLLVNRVWNGHVVPDFYAEGMTLREYYAGLAMQGMLCGDIHITKDFDFIIKKSIEYADTLIAELEKKEEK